MPPAWRLLGPVEAANGVLMFGLSASATFAVTDRLLELRLRRQHARLSVSGVTRILLV
jgi:hypothetical protein